MFTDIGFDTISIIHPFASAAADSHIGSLNDYSFLSGLGGGLYTLLISYLNPAQILTYIVPSALLPYTYILCMYTLDDITEHAEEIPLKHLLLISDVIILLLLRLVFGFAVTGQVAISKRAFVKVVLILFLYNAIFIAMLKKSRQFATLSLLLVVCLDVVIETYPIANTRTAITKEEYKTSLYNDGTKEAAADIQSKDLGLYRITKSYTSVFLNNAKVHQYNGTTSYTAVPSSSTSEYMLYNNIPFARDADYSKASKYIPVPYDNYYINTLLGVKYLFIKDMANLPSQYSVIEQVGDIYVCQNNRPLSFGYLYHHALSHDGYDKLSPEQIARDVDDIDTYYTFLDITQTLEDKNILSVEYLDEGDILHLGDSQLKVYSEYTPEIVERNLDLPNSSSLVFKISGEKQSMLFFADFEDAELADKLYEKYGHELDATYIQLGHHGNNALAPSYYLNLHPSAVYVDAPYFLYTGAQYKCKNTLEYLKDHDVACYTFHGAPHLVYVR